MVLQEYTTNNLLLYFRVYIAHLDYLSDRCTEYYEQVLKVLSFLSSTALKGMPVSGDDWYEIDDPADLNIAENRFANSEKKLEMLQKRFGGYWRFPQLIDYCYLVNPYFPPAARRRF